jgi:AcrR family transcriptional regulator
MADGYHHGNLRRALLDAALELIESEGVASLSLRAVARRAQVSHAAPYHHFADRAALVAAVAEEGFESLHAKTLTRMERAVDPRERFRESGIAYVLFAVEYPSHFRVMFSAELEDKSRYSGLQAAAAATYAVLIDAIERCQEAGFARAGDPQTLGYAAWSLVHGLASLILDGHFGPDARTPLGAERLALGVTALLWEGIGARGAP